MLKAVITSKSLISAGLDINRVLRFGVFFFFYDKILQIYRQIESGYFTNTVCQKTDKFQKSGERGVTRPLTPPPSHTHTFAPAWHPLGFNSIGLTGLTPISFIYIDTAIGFIFHRKRNRIVFHKLTAN